MIQDKSDAIVETMLEFYHKKTFLFESFNYKQLKHDRNAELFIILKYNTSG